MLSSKGNTSHSGIPSLGTRDEKKMGKKGGEQDLRGHEEEGKIRGAKPPFGQAFSPRLHS